VISIVITTYGDEAWRELAWSRAYPSALDQGAQEIIVHHEPNMQIGPARNAAGLLASGEYLCHLDADDELAPGYIDAMEAAIRLVPDPSMTLLYPTVRYMRKNRAQADLLRPIGDLRHDNFMVIGTVVPAQLFRSVGGFSNYGHGFEDWSAWAKCWRAGAEIVAVPSAVYVAHVNPQSQHRVRWRNRREQVAEHMRVQAELFPEGVA
jgi:glycosyltransferase involved in cell wall biosynthesis